MALTSLGIAHTAISLLAVGAGIAALWRDREIRPRSHVGRVYVWATALTCLTGFGIFQHGGFGKPHALSVLTLAVLLGVALADRFSYFGRWSRYVIALGMSFSFFLHWIPGITETFTRLPVGAPVFSSPDDPALAQVIAGLFVLFACGATLQIFALRGRQNRREEMARM